MPIFFQSPANKKGDKELLTIYKNGKVICSCLANLYNENRDYDSVYCRHIKSFLEAVCRGNLENYEEIKK